MAVQVRTKDTTTAFTTCGHQLIPWWRKTAPSISCTYRTKIESKVSVNRAGLRVSNSIRGCSSIHCRPVNRATTTAMQKNVWASAAWAEEIAGGRYNRTVSPPRIPCAITVPTAASAKIRSQRRFSTRQVQIARISVRSPATCAIMRWMCSNCTPPTSFGILYQEPKDVGQSGTDNPASLLVTSAPAMRSRKVQLARVTANLWCPWLYGLAMNFRTCSSDIPSDCSATELAGCTELYNPLSRNRRLLGTRDCSHPPGFER